MLFESLNFDGEECMQTYKVLVVLILSLIIMLIIYKIKKHVVFLKREKLKQKVCSTFGKINSEKYIDYNTIKKDWGEICRTIPDKAKIDDITWNDLEMDHIYKAINNCKSFAGEQRLYSMLHIIGNDETAYERMKNKIEFFEKDENERNEMWYIISSLGKATDSYYLPIFINNLKAFKIPHISLFRFMRTLFFLSFIPSIAMVDFLLLWFPIFVALMNMAIYAFYKNKYESYLNMLSSTLKILKVSQQIIDSGKLKYENTFKDLSERTQIFRKHYFVIKKLQSHFNANISGDTLTLLESLTFGITLWDLLKYDKTINFFIENQKVLRTLYEIIGQIDSAISIASFRKSLPFYCIPQFNNEKIVEAKDIFHPLIKKPIYNSITINRGCIITGANASGKSTFIKTIAINAILGQSVNTCIAKEFNMPQCAVITSIAVRDEVASGESYYMKEINYLKRIISSLNDEMTVLSVIDEILRGTNTNERIAASVSVMKYLYEKNSISIVATHDLKLTEMLHNYFDCFHFKEYINGKKMMFEYKIYPGPSKSTNAIRLLEYMGFPAQIVEEAEKISKDLL